MKNLIRKKYYGILFNKNSWWIGIHYSSYNKRWCINILPCLTLWIIKKNGMAPDLLTITYV